MYSTLLAHKKLHIRNFATESFTFLMRKVSLIIVCLLLINPQESDEQKAISFTIWLLWTDIYICKWKPVTVLRLSHHKVVFAY